MRRHTGPTGSGPAGIVAGCCAPIRQAAGLTTFETLGNLGDFVGGIGVVATLVYLAVQVRQNTLALRTASRQAIVAGMRDHVRLALEPGGDSFVHAVEAFPEVDPDAARYFATRMNDLLLFFQGAHALHEAGTLEDETYQAYLDFVAASCATPGGARYWDAVRDIYTARMAGALDARIEQGQLRDLTQPPSPLRESGEKAE